MTKKVNLIALVLAAIAVIAGVSACGGSRPPPATNAQAWAAGYKSGDTQAALDGFFAVVGDGAPLTVSSLKLYCQIHGLEGKGGMPRK